VTGRDEASRRQHVGAAPVVAPVWFLRLTTAARAKAVSGLDEVTRAALKRAVEKVLEDGRPPHDNVVALASHR